MCKNQRANVEIIGKVSFNVQDSEYTNI